MEIPLLDAVVLVHVCAHLDRCAYGQVVGRPGHVWDPSEGERASGGHVVRELEHLGRGWLGLGGWGGRCLPGD